MRDALETGSLVREETHVEIHGARSEFHARAGRVFGAIVIVIVVVSIRLLVFFFLLILGFLFLLVVALILGGGLHASLRVWEEDKGSGGRREASVRGASFAVS
jgi:hypothetical protein